jgi:hypothetical protein
LDNLQDFEPIQQAVQLGMIVQPGTALIDAQRIGKKWNHHAYFN